MMYQLEDLTVKTLFLNDDVSTGEFNYGMKSFAVR